MHKILMRTAAGLALMVGSPALAKGCIRGAVAGGVAGHYVGKGHAIMGATAGCIAAHHYYARQAAAKRAAQRVPAPRR